MGIQTLLAGCLLKKSTLPRGLPFAAVLTLSFLWAPRVVIDGCLAYLIGTEFPEEFKAAGTFLRDRSSSPCPRLLPRPSPGRQSGRRESKPGVRGAMKGRWLRGVAEGLAG